MGQQTHQRNTEHSNGKGHEEMLWQTHIRWHLLEMPDDAKVTTPPDDINLATNLAQARKLAKCGRS